MHRIPPILKASLFSILLVIVILLWVADAEEININTDIQDNWISTSYSLDHGLGAVYSWDKNSVTAYGNNDMGLFKYMNTALYPADFGSSIEKLRTVSMFTFGANKIEIADASWLQAQNDLGNTLSTGFERYSTLTDSNGMQPFGIITEDFERLSNEGLGEGLKPGSVNTQITLLLSDTYDPARIGKLTEQLNSLGTTMDMTAFNIQTVNFNNYNEMLSLYGESWSGWFELFGDPDIWSLFKTADGNGDDTLTYDDIMNRHYRDSNGAITCIWGSYTDTRISI